VVVSGVDGSAQTVATPPPNTQLSTLAVLGDLNADGHADVGLTYDQHLIVARSSTTGALIWSRLSPSTDYISGVERVPAGPGGVDAVLMHGSTSQDSVEAVLNGQNGHQISTLMGVYTQPIGDADGDGLSDLVYRRTNFTETQQSEEFTAYSSRSGHQLWDRTLIMHGEFPNFIIDRVTPAGDVHGDHVADFYVEMHLYSNSYPANVLESRHYIVSGRNGSVSNGSAIGTPLSSSVDGHGDDFAAVTSNRNLAATVYDGATRTAVWTYQRSAAKPISAETYGASDMTGDGHADLFLVASTGSTTDLSLIDGTTHNLRWRVVV
jgi:hypothetical protein